MFHRYKEIGKSGFAAHLPGGGVWKGAVPPYNAPGNAGYAARWMRPGLQAARGRAGLPVHARKLFGEGPRQ